jgi:hypothetical protein
MPKSARLTTPATNVVADGAAAPIAQHIGELEPVSVEYVGADQVLVSLKTKTGEIVSYSLKTAMMMNMVNASMAVVNGFTAKVFRDLNIF